MFLRPFRIPNWMSEELSLMALIAKMPQDELMRRMMSRALEEAWAEYGQGDQLTMQSVTVPERTEMSEAAQQAIERQTNAVLKEKTI